MTTTFYMFSKTDMNGIDSAQKLHEIARSYGWVHRGCKMIWGTDYSLRMAQADWKKWTLGAYRG